MGEHLLNKIWNLHKISTLSNGKDQLFIGLHLIHEVTSPQAFAMLKENGLPVLCPELTFATTDHIVPTDSQSRPLRDEQAETMLQAIELNTGNAKIRFFGLESDFQGIVHVIGPELGLTQPGMTIACGDSHTSTHGAFGAIAFGIGTSQVRDVLATQTLAITKPKVRAIEVSGNLGPGVYAKDIILKIISSLGVKGGLGYAYEYRGPVIDRLSMEERMTICNMSIEGGARFGYCNPDEMSYSYLKGRRFAPEGKSFERAVSYWNSIASDKNASFDDVFNLDVTEMEPMITWGINPGQSVGISESIPRIAVLDSEYREGAKKALEHMGFEEGEKLTGKKIDVAFIGSCTNSRITDIRQAARFVQGKRVSPDVRAFVVPGSKQVKKQAEAEGLDNIFRQAGFEWRLAGCSICLGMNPDKLRGSELCASSSNRNFIGRQGSPKGRTLLMSPIMVAAAALAGEVTDIRKYI
jgi:3-isopropylmalate/(R)-2-methylmalate dehydratase large subunit